MSEAKMVVVTLAALVAIAVAEVYVGAVIGAAQEEAAQALRPTEWPDGSDWIEDEGYAGYDIMYDRSWREAVQASVE